MLNDSIWKIIVDWGLSMNVDLQQSCLVLDDKGYKQREITIE